MSTQLILIAAGGAVGAVIQMLVVDRFGPLRGGAWLAAVACTLFGAVWALTDPNPWVKWGVADRETAAPLLYGLLAAAAPLSAVLAGDRHRHRVEGRSTIELVGRGLLVTGAALVVAATALMVGYLAVRGGYSLHRQLNIR